MVTRTVLVDDDGKEIGDLDALLGSIKAQPGQIRYREPVRTIEPRSTQHDEDMWKTYTTGRALQYPLPAWAVDELRLRLARSARYLGARHPDELARIDASRFKLTMRVEDAYGELIGNGLPLNNPALDALQRDTLVLLNFRMHAPLNRGRRVEKNNQAATPRRGRRTTSARRSK